MKYIIQVVLIISFLFSCENKTDTETKADNANSKFSSKEYEAALEAYDMEVKNNPSSHAYSGRAFTNLRLSKIDNAFSDFDKALEMDAENPDALAGKAFIFMYQDNFSEAVKYADLVFRKNSGYKFKLDKTINKTDLRYIQAFSEYSQGKYSLCYNYLKLAGIALSFDKNVSDISVKLLEPLKSLLKLAK